MDKENEFSYEVETPRKPLVKINMDSPLSRRFGEASAQPSPSPKKGSSSRVIESLHGEIDLLKDELFKVKNRNDELKKANEIIKKRRDQLVEQISNVKHENETVNSLLERKQRRITDLEAQLTEAMSSSDDLNFKVKSLQTRCDKLQQSEVSSVAEYERMKIAYDTIVTSQREFRDHYKQEVGTLREKLQSFIAEKDVEINKNIGLINKSDATIYRSIKSITIRSNNMEEMYQKRDDLLASTISDLKKITISSQKESETLLMASKELFLEIADKLQVDHTELLQSYFDDAEDKRNPFEESLEESLEEPQEETITEGGASENKELVVKKRQDKKSAASRSNSSASMEYRMSSLGKDLNSSIPITDRDTKVETPAKVQRTKSIKKATRTMSALQTPQKDSRRSSRIFESENAEDSKSNSTSRRSSKMIEKPKTNSMVGSTAETKEEQPPEDPQGVTGQKKKRRRRRKRANHSEVCLNSDNDLGDDTT